MFAAAGDDPAFPHDAVEVGRVVGAWGVKGGIKVKPFSADPQALFSSKRWFLQAPAPVGAGAGARPASPDAAPASTAAAKAAAGPRRAAAATAPALPSVRWPLLLRISAAREHGDHVVATAHDLGDRDAAQALAGARVFVARSSFPTPGKDEFYWVDLIGLAVHNRQGSLLGSVAGLVETGPTCVLRVAPAAAGGEPAGEPGDELLIPFVSAYVDSVDLAGRCLHVDWRADF